ncbi:uncharacterized protein M6B38_189580 [Iris pallida]|uniref:Secreted protein n=1 Tax=Iris pallida TaxID=29817 RepID=A0AAX6EHT2_IRIPA|nr:uncharacterized protein M6B38_189580 [Iris pallida]
MKRWCRRVGCWYRLMRVKSALMTWLHVSTQPLRAGFDWTTRLNAPRRRRPRKREKAATDRSQTRRAAFRGCSSHSLEMRRVEDQSIFLVNWTWKKRRPVAGEGVDREISSLRFSVRRKTAKGEETLRFLSHSLDGRAFKKSRSRGGVGLPW